MIGDERLNTYLSSLDTPNSPYLNAVERAARADAVPIIRQQMQSFLQVYLELLRPQKILEVGAAVGFSSLFMAEKCSTCQITTIENYPPRIAAAKKNFADSPYADRITLLEGDAAQILPQLEGTYDLIFMDAAKGQYIHFLPQVKRLVRKGGLLITDNVLQDGDILESHFAVERRNRTIYKRMREYLYTLKHDEDWITSIVPIADGASVSVRR